ATPVAIRPPSSIAPIDVVTDMVVVVALRVRLVLLRGCGRVLPLAQLDAADLAGQRLGQFVDELDAPRVRVLGKAHPHELGDLLRELVACLVARRENDECLDDGAATLDGRDSYR